MKEVTPKRLTRLAGFSTALLFAACGTNSPATPEPQNQYLGDSPSASGQVLGAKTGDIQELFREFHDKWNNVPNNFDNALGTQCEDLSNEWTVNWLGLPQFKGGWAREMWGQYSNLYDQIPKESGEKPKVGDIMVWDNSIGGHTGIATGQIDASGNEIIFEQNDTAGSPPHDKSYPLQDPTLKGWERAKAFETPPTAQEIIDQYFNLEGESLDQQIPAMGLKFFIETYTTKEKPLTVGDLNTTLQIVDINLNDWASEIPLLLSRSSNPDAVLRVHYKSLDSLSLYKVNEGEVEMKNFTLGTENINIFSAADIANKIQRREFVYLNFITRERAFDTTTNTWGEWGDWYHSQKQFEESYAYRVKNGQIQMYCDNCDIGSFSTYTQYDNPAKEIPWLGGSH